MKKLFLILLLTTSLASCITAPTPNIVLPTKECQPKIEYKVQQCPIPPEIGPIPKVLHISIDSSGIIVDEGGELLIRDYATIRKWKKQYY